MFIEVGLENDKIMNETGLSSVRQSGLRVLEEDEPQEAGIRKRWDKKHDAGRDAGEKVDKAWYNRIASGQRPVIETNSSAPPGRFTSIPRIALIALLVAVVVPGIGYRGAGVPMDGADAGVIGKRRPSIEKKADSPTDVCTRWSHQSALVNGTMYIYGGRASTNKGQTENTWSK